MQFRDLQKQYEVLKPEMDAAMIAVASGAHFISGEQVKTLEERLAAYVGRKHCITCGNGTDALELCMMAWGVGPGDAVFVPDFTFFASGEAVSTMGGTPVFYDVCADTFNADAKSLEAAIEAVIAEGKLTPKAVVDVDLFGLPADHEAVAAVCKKHGLLFLEDAAQGFGGMLHGKRNGAFGDAACTSFFPAKPLGCYGDGGAVFTDDLPLHTPLTLQETPALLLNRPSACIAAWRRTLFTDTGIRFRARGWGEDLCMTRKMLTAARSVVILPDVLYLYRQHEGSVTKRALDANAEIMDAIDDVLTWYQARGLFEQYENELGKLCVDNVLYDASVRILKAQSAHPLLPQLLDFTAARFPDYRHNPYLKGYPARKKLVLSLLGKKQYRAVHLLFAAAGH